MCSLEVKRRKSFKKTGLLIVSNVVTVIGQ